MTFAPWWDAVERERAEKGPAGMIRLVRLQLESLCDDFRNEWTQTGSDSAHQLLEYFAVLAETLRQAERLLSEAHQVPDISRA